MRIVLPIVMLFFLMSTASAGHYTVDTRLEQGQFQVTLPANPTTGYQWTLKRYDKQLFSLVDSHYVAPKTSLVGAGGQMVFIFKVKGAKAHPSSTKMNFVYARAWESKSATPSEVTVNFR